jgi:hypothetical protein
MASLGVNAPLTQLAGVTSPTIWSGKLLVKFYAASVVPAISNTEYEGEISDYGDKVKIRTTPDITIRDYTKNLTLTNEARTPSLVELEINQGKYWSFITDDVDVKQSNYAFVDDWTSDASEQMKISVDTDILAAINSDAHADNVGATAGAISGDINLGATGAGIALSKSNVLDYLVDCGTVLDEQNVPESDRFIVMPPKVCALIKKSDLRDASLSGDGTSLLRNGRLGAIDRFTLYSSNLLERVADGGTNETNMLFGHRSALTFAGQFVKNETIRAESTFGNINRGLKVYGYKVIKSEALGVLYGHAA